jgi:hypothetical protein
MATTSAPEMRVARFGGVYLTYAAGADDTDPDDLLSTHDLFSGRFI